MVIFFRNVKKCIIPHRSLITIHTLSVLEPKRVTFYFPEETKEVETRKSPLKRTIRNGIDFRPKKTEETLVLNILFLFYWATSLYK